MKLTKMGKIMFKKMKKSNSKRTYANNNKKTTNNIALFLETTVQ